MKPIYTFLDMARASVRSFMRQIARILNNATGGKLHPNLVTLIGVAAHVPIALLIAQQDYVLAAILLVFFGLFDTLDGELARLQQRASAGGMLLDASTDRMKEVILYMGVAYALVATGTPKAAVWAVAACGASLLVSYVKAKGETAVASTLSHTEANRIFQDGLLRFEIRILALVIGLLLNELAIVVAIIAVLAWATSIERLIKITRKLSVNG